MLNQTIKIAIIEDDETNQDYLSLIVRKIYCNPIKIIDPRTAITVLKHEHPDIVLLDIKLSEEISGIDIARLMKKDESLKNIPIIVVSSFAMQKEIADISKETKCNGYIAKPFVMNSLIDAIDAQLERIACNAETGHS